MKKLALAASFTAILFALFTGCKTMPNDGVPFYVQIDSVELEVNDSSGALSHKITDVWVEANSTNLGVYEYPITFPVLLENDVRFIVSPGIWESGQAGVRVEYPFYSPDTFTLNAKKGEQYVVKPKFEYKLATKFAFIEDFKVGSNFTTVLDKVASEPGDGHGDCGRLSLNSIDSVKTTATQTKYDLPEGQEIWLEFDYKCDVPFFVGLYGTGAGAGLVDYSVIFMTPHAEWNKLYLKLSNPVGSIRSDYYQIYFKAVKPVTTSTGNVYLDNIKLVHF